MPLRSTFGTPALRMVLVLLLCAASLSMAVWTAARQPTTGLSFRPGDRLSSDKGSMVIDEVDLTPEPGIYEDYATLERFYTRQSELGSIISGGVFTITGEDEETIAGVINAASLCGYLLLPGQTARPSAPKRQSGGPKRA